MFQFHSNKKVTRIKQYHAFVYHIIHRRTHSLLKRIKRVHVNPNFSDLSGAVRKKNLESIYVLTSLDVRLFYKMKWLPCTDPEKFSKVGGRGVLCIYSVILLCKRKKIDFLGGFRTPPPSDPPLDPRMNSHQFELLTRQH